MPTYGNPIMTIGHSNHPMDGFPELLQRHQVQTVIDVRTTLASRCCPALQPQLPQPDTVRQQNPLRLGRRTARRPAESAGTLHARGKGGLAGHGHDQRLHGRH